MDIIAYQNNLTSNYNHFFPFNFRYVDIKLVLLGP